MAEITDLTKPSPNTEAALLASPSPAATIDLTQIETPAMSQSAPQPSTSTELIDLTALEDEPPTPPKQPSKPALIRNILPFECKICYIETEANAGTVLFNCGHGFCDECLRQYAETAAETAAQLKCPEPKCETVLYDREVRALNELAYERQLQNSLKIAEAQSGDEGFHCKTPDCSGWVIVPNDTQITSYTCHVCAKVNCLKCRAMHEGQSCAAYSLTPADKESAEALENLVRDGDAMRCPQCKAICMKINGCNVMHCLLCKRNFIWTAKQPKTQQVTVGPFPFYQPIHVARQRQNHGRTVGGRVGGHIGGVRIASSQNAVARIPRRVRHTPGGFAGFSRSLGSSPASTLPAISKIGKLLASKKASKLK